MERAKETELNILKGLFLTPGDVCKILKIGRKKCLALFHRDDFPSFIYGKTFLIEKNAFLDFFKVRNVILQNTDIKFE
jgi:hypothetical protein